MLGISIVTQEAYANQLMPNDNQELKQKAKQEAQYRQELQQKKDVFLQPKTTEEEATEWPNEIVSFRIHEIQIIGGQQEKFQWMKKFLSQYEERMIGKKGIQLIVKKLTNELLERGYITTRIVIPEQDLSSGTLKLQVIAGIIGNIKFDQDKHCGNWQNAFPTRPGNILNLRDIEQGLEQLKRVPSQDADFKIVPGKNIGESNIVVSLKQSPNVRTAVSIDDSGSKVTGKLQSFIGVSVDNLVNANDIFNLSFNQDAQREGSIKGTKDRSISYSFPSGNWLFTFLSQQNKYHQTIYGMNQKFLYSGESGTYGIKIDKIIDRKQTSKTNIEWNLIKKHSKNFIEGTEIEVQRKNTTALEMAIERRQYLKQSVVDVRLAYRKGVPWLGAQSDYPKENAPTSNYKMWIGEINYMTPILLGKINGKYTSTIHLQNTPDTLYATDYISIGNRYTVRGFDGEETLAAEKGWYSRNEFSFPVGKTRQELYLGFDYGQVSGPAVKGLPDKVIAGTAIGIRGKIDKISYEVFTAWPIKKPSNLTTKTPAVGFQLVYQL